MPHNKITGIAGPKGSGKTYTAAKMFGSEERAVLYHIVTVNPEYHGYATHITDDLPTLEKVLEQEKQFRVIYLVKDEDLVPRGKELIYLSAVPVAQLCYRIGNLDLYLDEAHELCTQQSIDWRLRKVIRLARNNALDITWIAQGFKEIHREIRRNTDEYYLFKTDEPVDLDAISEKCGELTAMRVANLRPLTKIKTGETVKVIPGECLVWSRENV